MKIVRNVRKTSSVKIELVDGKKKIGRAFLYLIKNDLHNKPYGLMEDVFVNPAMRGQGLGTLLIKEVIKTAKKYHCYKLIGNSRTANEKAHKLYERLGFKRHGFEFRMDLINTASSCPLRIF
jgi:GNAT superfamily N-acetyltransferase